jgi:hypothetical protein
LVLPIVLRDFNSQKEVAGHPDFFYMGATVGGQKTLCVPNASGRSHFCGDGLVDSTFGEQCDLGALNGTGSCSDECQVAW